MAHLSHSAFFGGSLEKTHHSCTTNRQRGYSQSRRFKEANRMAWAHFRPTFNENYLFYEIFTKNKTILTIKLNFGG